MYEGKSPLVARLLAPDAGADVAAPCQGRSLLDKARLRAVDDAAALAEQEPEMLRPSPYGGGTPLLVEASAAAARETGLLDRGVRADTLLRIVLASSRLRPLAPGPKRTATSPMRPPPYSKWLEEAMLLSEAAPQPRRALCLFGASTHSLLSRWCPAALSHRYAQRQTLSTLDGDDQHWDERIERDTQLVVVHNDLPRLRCGL